MCGARVTLAPRTSFLGSTLTPILGDKACFGHVLQ